MLQVQLVARDLWILDGTVSSTLCSIFLKRWPTSTTPIASLVLIDSGGVLMLLTLIAINGCRRFVWRAHDANHMGLENSCTRCGSYAHNRREGISGMRNAAKGTRRGTCWAHPVSIAPVCRSGSRRFFWAKRSVRVTCWAPAYSFPEFTFTHARRKLAFEQYPSIKYGFKPRNTCVACYIFYLVLKRPKSERQLNQQQWCAVKPLQTDSANTQ